MQKQPRHKLQQPKQERKELFWNYQLMYLDMWRNAGGAERGLSDTLHRQGPGLGRDQQRELSGRT
jgi:hypothetical protein